MMRINQFSNASMFQTQSARTQGNSRMSNQDFRTSLQNNSQAAQGMTAGNNQPQMIAGQQNSIQLTAPEGFSGFSGVSNMPMMPDGNMPEMPAMPDGETPPAMPDGETPPAMPDGETPPEKPNESDGGMSQPPSGMPGGFSGMNRPGGSFSGMSGMSSFNAMSFAMNIR